MGRLDPEFKIGDRVFVREQPDRAWYVIGTAMRPAYDLLVWEYRIGRAVYGDYPMGAFGVRVDVETRDFLRLEQLITEEQHLKAKGVALQEEIAATEKRLAELKSLKIQ